MPDTKAVIRIGAMADSTLRKALASTVAAGRKAAQQLESAEIKAAKDTEKEKIRAIRAAERAMAKATQAASKAAKDAERETLRASKAAERGANKASQAAIKGAQAHQRAAQRAARDQARAAEKLAREEAKWAEWVERAKYKAVTSSTRMAERAAMRERRESEKTARQQIRDSERAAKAQQSSRRRIAAAAGGAVLGAGAAAVGRARSFATTFGARSNEEMLAKAVETHRRLVILGDMGGISEEQRGGLKSKILATSARTGLDTDELVGGLETAQDRFSDLKGFAEILDQIADIAVATKTPVEDVVASMGVFRRQLGLSDDEMKQLGGAMVSAADLGSVSYKEMADNFGGAIGAMGRNANLKGLGGAKTALAITQALGESDVGAAEASTLGVRVVSALNDVKVQAAVKKAYGVNVTEGGKLGGVMRDLPTILQELADKGFMNPEKGAKRQAVFTEERSQRGIEVLTRLWQNNPEKVKQLLGVDPEEGAATVKRRMAALSSGVEGQAATLGARQFQTFMEGDSMQQYLETAVKSADTLAKFEAGHPMMTEVIGIAGGALKGLAAAVIAERVASGAGAALAGGAASTAGAAGAAGAGAVGLGTMVAGGAAAGAFGFFGTQALLDATGGNEVFEALGRNIWSALHYDAPRSSTRGVGGAPAALPYSGGGGAVPWSPPPEMAGGPAEALMSTPEATLKIQIEGPGRVTSVQSDGFGEIQTTSLDTGRRDSLPP